MSVGKGFADRYLTHEETSQVVQEGLATLAVDGKRVLVIIPDGTRTMPMPLMYDLLEAHLAPRVAALDYLVALGTHPMMDDEHLSKLVGRPVTEWAMRQEPHLQSSLGRPRELCDLGFDSCRRNRRA